MADQEDLASGGPRTTAPRPSGLWRQVILPADHGGWSFLAEPILLALLVACSGAGLLIAAAAAAAFLARRPLRLLITDRRKGNRYPRTRTAERAFAALAIAGALALAVAVALARGPVLTPLALAAPLAATALVLEIGGGTRALAAELAGTLALSASAPAIGLAGGMDAWPAMALWLILASRVVPTVLYVRARLRLERGEPAHARTAIAAAVVASVGASLLAAGGLAPWLGVAAITLLAGRAAHGLSAARPRMSASRLGASEVVFGAVFVLATAAGWALGM